MSDISIQRAAVYPRPLRIPINSDTCSNPYRTPIPMDIGQVSERSDALGLVIKRCPI